MLPLFCQSLYKQLVVSLLVLLISVSAVAQNWEADIIRSINQENGNSDFWKIMDGSAKPISVSLPIAMLTTSIISKNKQLQTESFQMLGGLTIAIGATEGLKVVVDRPRPYEQFTGIYANEIKEGKSFPSGHSSVAFFTATSLAINHPKWYVIVPAYTWAVSVSYARLYYGQHHPSDLIASAIIGAGSAIAAKKIQQAFYSKRNRTRVVMISF